MPIECYWARLELSFSTGRRQCARCPHTRAANRAFTERRRDEMRGAGKALLHAATRRAITKQLPLEGLCMQSSTWPRNHFCFETFFRRLRASAREKKIETEIPKTNTKPIPNILAPVLPDSEAPLPRNSKLNTQRRRTRGLTPGWPDSWASTLNAGGRDRAGQEWVAWGPGDRGVACHMEGLEQSQGTSLANQKKIGRCPRRTCCVFTVPPDACGFSANAKRWPGEPKHGRRAPAAPAARLPCSDACGVNAIARHWPGEPKKRRRPVAPAAR